MIRQETTPMQKAQVHCETCWNTLLRYDGGLITQAIIDLVNSKAVYHEQRHPGHNLEVLIYKNAPEAIEDI